MFIRKQNPVHFARILLLLLLVLSMTAAACPPTKPPPPLGCNAAMMGANRTFITSGVADDGDDSNGPRDVYTNLARRGTDNATTAFSDPKSFKELRGEVTAQFGAMSTRLASAIATSKAQSSFTITRASECSWTLLTTFSATINSAQGQVQVVARVLDDQGNPVKGSNLQVFYALTENNPKPMTFDVTKDGKLDGNIQDGGVYQDPIVRPASFQIPPGTYTMLFEMNVLGLADTMAQIRAISTAELK